mmetsp:Transcript_33058/g.108621  ORF Transcript_33058/g.108621 Transcript_33058/m.108621 type:complete len:243 (+) Transcript_33058:26-754(+)
MSGKSSPESSYSYRRSGSEQVESSRNVRSLTSSSASRLKTAAHSVSVLASISSSKSSCLWSSWLGSASEPKQIPKWEPTILPMSTCKSLEASMSSWMSSCLRSSWLCSPLMTKAWPEREPQFLPSSECKWSFWLRSLCFFESSADIAMSLGLSAAHSVSVLASIVSCKSSCLCNSWLGSASEPKQFPKGEPEILPMSRCTSLTASMSSCMSSCLWSSWLGSPSGTKAWTERDPQILPSSECK